MTDGQTLDFCEFNTETDNMPKPQHSTWDDLRLKLSTHRQIKYKELGRLFSPTIYKQGQTRGNAAVESLTMLVADIDHAKDWGALVAPLRDYEYIAYSTFSHKPDEPRYRFVIPFSNQVRAEDWRGGQNIWQRCNEHLFKGKIDANTKDESRIHFFPYCPIGTPTSILATEYHPGRLLDPYALPQAAANNGFKKAEGLPDKIGAGERNSRLSSLAGTMRAGAASESAILAALLETNRIQCDPPLDEDEVRGIAKSIARYAPNPQITMKGKATIHDDEPTGEGFNLTDYGNAERLVGRHKDEFHYLYANKKWLTYDGTRWVNDSSGEVERIAKETVRSIYHEAGDEPDKVKRKAIDSHARRSESDARIKAMLSLVASEPGVALQPNEMDASKWHLNVLNGTIDLKTGELHPHNCEDLISKLAPVWYDPDAVSPIWNKFLDDTTQGDREIQGFLQRAVGYSLTGDISEEKLFFVHGPAAAGKSTFIEAIKVALGEYGTTAEFETFLSRNQVGGARNDIARLAGMRFVASNEVDEGKKLAEGLIKMLTGGDKINARFLYHEFFEFTPTFKLWLAANHAPKVSDDDDAMWRRILRIPFEHVIPRTLRDPAIKTVLCNPMLGGPAVLAWAVQGCLAWQKYGLGVPSKIESATESYRGEMDPLSDFLKDCCEIEDGAYVRTNMLRQSYENWARSSGMTDLLKGRAWGDRLKRAGCTEGAMKLGGQTPVRVWRNIKLQESVTQTSALWANNYADN